MDGDWLTRNSRRNLHIDTTLRRTGEEAPCRVDHVSSGPQPQFLYIYVCVSYYGDPNTEQHNPGRDLSDLICSSLNQRYVKYY